MSQHVAVAKIWSVWRMLARDAPGELETGSRRYGSGLELRTMGVGHSAPQSPAEGDEAPGADDSVEDHRGDNCNACAATHELQITPPQRHGCPSSCAGV